MLARYILDKAANARETVNLPDDRDIYTSVAFGLKDDYHKAVWYSRFCTGPEQVWMSEMCSSFSNYGLTAEQITTAPQKFKAHFEEEREKYRNRSRKTGETWKTVHKSIYNLATSSLTVSTQEGEEKHCFSLRR